jgi:hypothetical protein
MLLSTFSAGSLEIARFAELDLPAWPRLLEQQRNIPPEGRLFFLEYDGESWGIERLPVRPLGTLNEIVALRNWLDRHSDVGSVLVVSSGLHLRRVRMCCRALLPRRVAFALAAVPGETARATNESVRRQDGLPGLIVECAKLALYGIVLGTRAFACRLRTPGPHVR